MKANLIIALSGILFLAIGCGKNVDNYDKPVAEARQDIVLTKAQAELVSKGNAFALNLFCETVKQEEGSFVMSPLSVEAILSLMCNGASGQTQAEILNALGYEAGSVGDVNEYYQYLTDALYKADKTVSLSLANSVVVNSSLATLKDGFANSVQNYYDALVKDFRFDSESTQAVSFINSWAKEKTNGMIPELFKSLDSDVALLIANAVYFKGCWNSTLEFNTKNTKEGYFICEDKSKSRVSYMNLETSIGYFSNSYFQAVRLPYGNGAFAMDVILPNTDYALLSLSQQLSSSGLPDFYSSRTVKLRIPRFETNNQIELNDALKNMGMVSMFTENADFSDMLNISVLLSRVFQKSKIKVDEKGTESAAVTVATFVSGAALNPPVAPPIPEFYATRPFVYVIRETSTGAILFMGAYKGK